MPPGLPVTVLKVDDLGREKIVSMDLDGHVVQALLPEECATPQDPVAIFNADNVHLYLNDTRLVPVGEGVMR